MKAARRLVQGFVFLLALAVLAGGAWAAVWWARYPKAPDVAKVELKESIAFIGTDDFNRLTEADRKRYVLAIADRLREKSLAQIVGLMLHRDGNRQQVEKNVRTMRPEDRQAIGAAMARVFLDKFYAEDEATREFQLMVLVRAQQGEIGRHPERFGLPRPDELKEGMSRFFAQQPPRTQAQMGQFLTDLRHQREQMGLKSPWEIAGSAKRGGS